MTSRSNAETVEKIGRAPERRRGKEQARGGTSADGATEAPQPLGGPSAQNGRRGRWRRAGPRPAGADLGHGWHFSPRVFAPPCSHVFCVDFAVLAPKAAGCMSPPRTCSRALPSAMPSPMRQKPRGQIQASTSPGLTRVSRPLLLLPCAGENVPIQEHHSLHEGVHLDPSQVQTRQLPPDPPGARVSPAEVGQPPAEPAGLQRPAASGSNSCLSRNAAETWSLFMRHLRDNLFSEV